MPLYHFSCNICAYTFEDLRKVEDPLPKCPECGGDTKLIISAPGLIRKKGSFPFKPLPPRPGPLPKR